MSFDTIVGLVFLGMAVFGYVAHLLSTRINWAMIYFNMLGGEEYDCK